MLYTIGYTFIEDTENPNKQLAPALFFNEPDLKHLSWIATVYPKTDDTEAAKKQCLEQLCNYIQYYRPSPMCIIGGEASTLAAVCQMFDHPSCMLLGQERADVKKIIEPYCDLSPVVQAKIVCIDAHDLHNPDFSGTLAPQSICMVINYDYTNDTNQSTLNAIKDFLKKLPPS